MSCMYLKTRVPVAAALFLIYVSQQRSPSVNDVLAVLPAAIVLVIPIAKEGPPRIYSQGSDWYVQLYPGHLA